MPQMHIPIMFRNLPNSSGKSMRAILANCVMIWEGQTVGLEKENGSSTSYIKDY